MIGIPPAMVKLGTLRVAKRIVLVAAVLVALALGAQLVARGAGRITGWEAYSIAQSVAAGHGFSYPEGRGWLFDERDRTGSQDSSQYRPTAWVDPVYTHILAALIHSTGSLHKYAGAGLNLLLFVVVVVLTYRLASQVEGVLAGYVAATLIVIILGSKPAWALHLNNTLMATVFVLLCAGSIHNAVSAPSIKTAAVMGLVTGLTILVCPGAIAFLPVALVVICLAHWPRWRSAAIGVSVALCLALVVLAPWAIRNHLAFGEFVVVRTGSGQITFVSTVATGAAVDPGTIAGEARPPWRATDAKEAIKFVTGPAYRDKRRELERFQMDYARATAGDAFGAMNEAQRDNWFKHETRNYLLKFPRLCLELAVFKMLAFATATGPIGVLLLAMSTMGAVVAVVRRRLDLLALVMCVAGFAAPFLLIAPYFARYRIPIEPIIVVTAVLTVCELGRWGIGGRPASRAGRRSLENHAPAEQEIDG